MKYLVVKSVGIAVYESREDAETVADRMEKFAEITGRPEVFTVEEVDENEV